LTNRLRQAIVIAGCAALLAPATSSAAPPEATDFTQALGGVERATGNSEDAYKSRVLEAPARFDLAGLTGEVRESELRGRVKGGEWTDWTETAHGDPVWFGGMDELQVRTHGWRPSGSVHYVSVSEGLSETSGRAGGGAGPNVISRRQWGANKKSGGCKPREAATYGGVKAAVVHHTVSATDYSEAEAPGMVLGICRFHRNSNGWNDIGYNALVDRFGNIYEGRAGGLGRAVIGAHAQGVNAQTTGVAVIGTHTSTPVSKPALNGVAKWLAWKLPQHGIDGSGRAHLVSAGGDSARYPAGTEFKAARIFGHRVANYTGCPGDALIDQLPKLRKKVARRIAAAGGGVG
jgi:hypothetical protein